MPQANTNDTSGPHQPGKHGTRHPDKHSPAPDWASLIVEGIEEALFAIDTDWRFTYINSRATAVLGRPKDALLGKVLWEAFPTLIGSSFEPLYRRVMAEGKPQRIEDFSHTTQAWYDVRAYPLPVGLIIYFQDITARKQLEQSIQESEARFKVLSTSSFEGVIIHQNGIVVEANQSAAHMLGHDRVETFIGQSVYGFVAQASLAEAQRQLAAGYAGVYEVVAMRKDASSFPVEARARAIEYHGQSARVLAFRDITERKQAEDMLHKTQSQLLQAQKMESVGRLAGGVAHDFNNLLTAIMGYGELVLSDLRETDQLYGDVLEIQRAAKRAAALTRQLLAFSRQQVLEPKVLDLNAAVANMDALLQRMIGEDIELVSLLDPSLAQVLADPNQIEQVILNLAVNARDAMPEGGQLTIETAHVELDQHYRSAGHPEVKTGSYIMLAVTDTGTGMDQATQAHIFEPFFTTKDVGKGSGLGLSMVYGIVRQSGGSIWVYSELGVGTTFKIYLPNIPDTLPAQPPAAPETPPSTTETHRSGPAQTILVVEDDALVRELIHRVLAAAGYITLNAQNGEEALELLATYRGQIDVMLTDMVMPRMGGRELIERLRPEWGRLKLLCMSGYTDRTMVRHGILDTYDAFLQKPFTPNTLLQRIDALLRGA